MENIALQWLVTHIPMVATWVIGIGAISIGIKKYGPKVRKFIKVGSEGLDLIDELLNAVQDDKITDEEIKTIVKEVNEFKASLQ